MPLAELQRRVRDAIVNEDNGDGARLAPLLVGGSSPARRLDIHRRHYEESLTAAVVGRFPATVWLIGPTRLEAAARAFVHVHPPTAPCIAECGTAFPGFLASWPGTARLAYVPAFADLDWHLGRIAVSVDLAAIGTDRLARLDPETLADANVILQPGTHYLAAQWAIDALITMYLEDARPDSWTLQEEAVHLEVRGARGAFTFSRLNAPEYAFRASLSAGQTLGAAVSRALDLDASFDPGAALLALVRDRLVIAIGRPEAGGRS